LEQIPLPPPPPSSVEQKRQKNGSRREFHLPRTNFLKGVRRKIAALEKPPNFKDEMEPVLGAIMAFILSAFFTAAVSLGEVVIFSPIYEGANEWIGSVFVSPPTEEIMKLLAILAVAILLPRIFVNRRYAAAMGAASGFGYMLSENITYFANPQLNPSPLSVFVRLLPISHPVLSAFSGIAVFVLISRMSSGMKLSKAILGMPLALFLVAILNHSLWNAWQFGVARNIGVLGQILPIIVVSGPFVIILRDLLGGHFNFQHFFDPIPEPIPSAPPNSDITPPPPPPPTNWVPARQKSNSRNNLVYLRICNFKNNQNLL
jgi:RsiW-degrading membrane proteinase PrsW (M82 family)